MKKTGETRVADCVVQYELDGVRTYQDLRCTEAHALVLGAVVIEWTHLWGLDAPEITDARKAAQSAAKRLIELALAAQERCVENDSRPKPATHPT